MEIQPQLVLLQKTLLNIEGLGRMLYPQLDLWTTAKPFMEQWMRDRVGPRAFLRRLQASLPELSEMAPAMPQLAYRALSDAVDGRLRVRWESAELDGLRRELRRHNRRTVGAVAGGSLLLSGTLIVTLGPPILSSAALGAGLLAAGALLLVRALWPAGD
jgi:ubiquinone biosynthesis protein